MSMNRSEAWKRSHRMYEVYRDSWRKWAVYVFPDDAPAFIDSMHRAESAAKERRAKLCIKMFNKLIKDTDQ